MDKLELVEKAFGNGDEIVVYDKAHDTIYVCFGGCKVSKDKHTITFKDCCVAEINDGDKEYWGDIKNGSNTLVCHLKEKINENFIPTIFYENEMEVR